MANQIRLKRASGSDPSASDLVLGEVAVRTDNGKLFTKKDNGNVAEIGGSGISDGDKGDITVSNSGDTFTIDNNAVNSAKIANDSITANELANNSVGNSHIIDATITNAEINGSAAIAGTKISPNFGSQNIVTTGTIASGDITVSDVNPKIVFTDTDNNPDYTVIINGGEFKIRDDTNSAIRFSIASDGTVDVAGNLDVGAGLDVTGNIISTAHITGVSDSTEASFIAKGDGSSQDGYIQLNCSQNSHGIKLKSPPHSASQSYTLTFPSDIQNAKFLTTDANGNLSWGTPTDTNTQLSNSQVRAAVEAASDSNVFTDADHSKLNGIEASATADQTASEILTLIKTVDGQGSGLDADFFDGLGSGSFLRSDAADTASGDIGFSGGAGAVTINANSDIRLANGNWTGDVNCKIQHHNNSLYLQGGSGANNNKAIILRGSTADRFYVGADGHFYPNVDSTYDIGSSSIRVRNGYFDTLYGSGANLTNLPSQTDQNFTTALKNKLDGIAASATNVTNNNQLTNGAGYITSAALAGASDGGNAALLDGIDSTQFLRADQDDSTTGILSLETNSQYPLTIDGNDNGKIVLEGSSMPYIRFREGTTDKAYFQWNSGGYIELFNQETSESLRIKSGANGLVFYEGGNERTVFHSGNDGSGSNLDADKLDGQQGSYYLDYGNLTNVPSISSFPSGTRMIFQQTSAPTGWTKDTSDTNQRALRVVSGSASSGGSVDFTTAFASKGVSGSIANGGNNTNNGGNNTNNATSGGNVNNHTLSEGRMPSHKHIGGDRNIFDQVNGFYGQAQNNAGGVNYPGARYDPGNPYAQTDKSWTSNTGSTQAHSHSFSGSAHSHSINSHSHTINAHNHSFSGTAINLAVRYLDVIIAQKD